MNLGVDAKARTFPLPVETATEKLAFIGRTGSGKTYGATKLAELLLAEGVQVVALDPVGVWRGLRMGGGFNVYIFGGLRGDYPLEPTAGAIMADLIVDRGISAVLDVSQFETDAEKARFASAFADRFFFRKKSAPGAVHLFIEEAQEFIPQNPQKGEERMLHAFQRIWKLGRNFGIGGTIITQRPQEVSKKALNQAGTLFVFQLTGPQERKAIEGWISDNGVTAGDLHELLPKLKVGSPHVWSPTFLGISETITIGRKRSPDVSSTPQVGATVRIEQPLTPIDGERLRADMAATVERAKENDPEHLRTEIRRLKAAQQAAPAPAKTVEVPVFDLLTRGQIDATRAELELISGRLLEITEQVPRLRLTLDAILLAARQRVPASTPPRNHTATESRAAQKPAPAGRREPTGDAQSRTLSKAERAILISLAQYGACSRNKLAAVAGYSVTGGGFLNALSSLRTASRISRDEPIAITSQGEMDLGEWQPLPTGAELRAQWLGRLGKAERAILTALAATYPDGLSKGELALRAGYEATGGGFLNALSSLRTLELITRGEPIQASENLF